MKQNILIKLLCIALDHTPQWIKTKIGIRSPSDIKGFERGKR